MAAPTPLKLCWVKGEEDALQTSLDKLTMILNVQVGDKTVEIDLRGILHASSAIHNVTHCGSLVLRTSKDGTFSGLIDELKKNPGYATFSEAVVARARRLADKRDDKRKRTETEVDPQASPEVAEDGDVEFVKERTRQERDSEGMANAVPVE